MENKHRVDAVYLESASHPRFKVKQLIALLINNPVNNG